MRPGRTHFDLIARHYDQMIRRSDDDPLPALVRAGAEDRVLDIGGGTGRNAPPIVVDGACIIICDSSLEMLRLARTKALPAVQADVRRLPFASKSFTRVIVVDAFHHFVDPTPAVAQPIAATEITRVTRSRGRIVVEEPNIHKRSVKWLAVAERLLLMRSRFLPAADIAQLFAAAGARITSSREDHFNIWLVFEP